jgi:hypothetical protein
MSIEHRINADLEDFARETERDLPELHETARELAGALNERKRARHRLRARAAVVCLVAAMLAVPIPYPEHGELRWSSVYALAKRTLFRVEVDLRGKTNREAEAEIREQVAKHGWTAKEVHVERDSKNTVVELRAGDQSGRRIHLRRKEDGNLDTVELQPEPLDDLREPGMTDAQLREKIFDQLEARGLEGDVSVHGDFIRGEVHRKGGLQ